MKRAKMFPNRGNRSQGHGQAVTAGYVVVTPSLPKMDNRSVPCPTCGVLVGESCVSGTTGFTTSTAHPSRHRMATRKWNAEADQRAAAQAEKDEGKVECPECHVLLVPRKDGRIRAHEVGRPGSRHGIPSVHCKGTGQPVN